MWHIRTTGRWQLLAIALTVMAPTLIKPAREAPMG
jgi:hypothetical protein